MIPNTTEVHGDETYVDFTIGQVYDIAGDDEYVSVGYTYLTGVMQRLRCCSISALDAVHIDVMIPLSVYTCDMGCTGHRLEKQLELDTPRACIYLSIYGNFLRLHSGKQVEHYTHLGAFCTQCVMAPIVEWYMREGVIAHEHGRSSDNAMIAVIEDNGSSVRVSKSLGLRDWSGNSLGRVQIHVYASADHESVVVSLVHTLASETPSLLL